MTETTTPTGPCQTLSRYFQMKRRLHLKLCSLFVVQTTSKMCFKGVKTSLEEQNFNIVTNDNYFKCSCDIWTNVPNCDVAHMSFQNKKKAATIDSAQPVSVTTYIGKLVQVTDSTRVMVGDHNCMHVSSSHSGMFFDHARKRVVVVPRRYSGCNW